ncbi:EAL domain-containing protein [Psychrosphaera sp. F3M07]|nr:EAL domain-containing protein [Psychrosphaera sp. F3M07]MBU2917955.1 EAL domain-containing protein [Psychrosphaera sp. F3M07]
MIQVFKAFFMSIPWAKKRLELSALIVSFVLLFGFQTERLDLISYDRIVNIFTPSATDHTVTIEIDDKSIAYLGEWPWTRDVHAELLEALKPYNVKAVGFDVLFVDNRYSTAEQDLKFANAIKQAGNVVLPVSPKRDSLGGVPELLPQSDLVESVNKLGHVDFEIDKDGIIRRTYLYAGYQRSSWPVFALALTQVAYPNRFTDNGEMTSGNGWIRRDPVFVNFSLPKSQNRLNHLSYIDVLSGNVEASDLQDKIVLIGMNATAMGDQFATPLTTNHKTMSGVEINAHVINSLLNDSVIHQVNEIQFLIISIVLAILSILAFSFTTATRLLPILALLVIGSLSISALLVIHKYTWYPPVLLISLQILLYAAFSLIKTDVMRNTITSLNHKLLNDDVTDLPNETALEQYIEQSIHVSNNAQLQLITLEVTKFKGISDLLGNSAGNELLNTIKKRIQSILPANAYLSRCNNAEFSICLAYVLSPEQIKLLCEQLISVLSPSYIIQDDHFRLPVHIGVCNYPSDGDNAFQLRAASLAALNRAMEQKDASICFYSSDIKEGLHDRARLESDLSKAIANNEIEVHYQPQVSSKDGSIIGAEALARWRHPVRGLVGPDTFIPVAESSGLILEIGNWIMKQACFQAKRWQLQGHTNFRIAVNLSSKQFTNPDLFDEVIDALTEVELDPHYLELELTESCVIEELDTALLTMKKLKDLGIALSIDDFGTGYSSLSYLKQFPMDRLKIDRSFISEITSDKESQDITKAIISMAHSLNMGVIAEGIESVEQHSFLNDIAVEELQGYYFGKPTTAANMDEMLKHNKNKP